MDDDKVFVLTIVGIVIIITILAIVFTACHEVIENGDARRCAEYNWNCKEEDE